MYKYISQSSSRMFGLNPIGSGINKVTRHRCPRRVDGRFPQFLFTFSPSLIPSLHLSTLASSICLLILRHSIHPYIHPASLLLLFCAPNITYNIPRLVPGPTIYYLSQLPNPPLHSLPLSLSPAWRPLPFSSILHPSTHPIPCLPLVQTKVLPNLRRQRKEWHSGFRV